MKNYCKIPIDILLMKKITKVMCLVLRNGVSFNHCSDKIIVLKTTPTETIANHNCVSQDSNNYRTKPLFENEVKCSWMITKDLSIHVVKINDTQFKYFPI